MTREELLEEIDLLGLSAFKDEILRVCRPCLQFVTVPANQPIPCDRSKIGGDPEVPEGFEWPHTHGGIPLLFLARVAETDVALIYPHLRGYHLLFFGSWGDESMMMPTGRIIKVPVSAPVNAFIHPPRPEECLPRLDECFVRIEESVALPDANDEFESWLYSEALKEYFKPQDPWRKRADGEELLTRPSLHYLVEKQFGPQTDGLSRAHRVFGYPLFTQGHPVEAAEQSSKPHYTVSGESKESFIRGCSRWVPVLSLETDDHCGLSFGDTGNCGFLVTQEALASGSFEDVEFYEASC